MEGLTRLVADSLARHGFDRPVDFRRLQWSRWFRCDSHHSLLYVPSKPGVFALAEEILSGDVTAGRGITPDRGSNREGHDFSRAEKAAPSLSALAAEGISSGTGSGTLEAQSARRMLAVTQFFEADDMAFVLDRMLSRPNPMRARLESGCYFIRFVVIEDQLQRRTVSSALNQWIVSAAEKASGLGSQFASSLELTPATEFVARTPSSATAGSVTPPAAASQLDSGAATNIHRPPVFPSGF
jgi:hypothetical protein